MTRSSWTKPPQEGPPAAHSCPRVASGRCRSGSQVIALGTQLGYSTDYIDTANRRSYVYQSTMGRSTLSIQQSTAALVRGGHNPDRCHHHDYVKHAVCPCKVGPRSSRRRARRRLRRRLSSVTTSHIWRATSSRLSRSGTPRARRGLCDPEVTSWPSPRRAQQRA